MSDTERLLSEATELKVQGAYDEAAVILKNILASEESNAEARRQLGLIYGFQGLFDESLEELAKAVELDPSSAAFLCDMAMTHAMLGMYDEAREEFVRVLVMDPDNKTAKQQMIYFGDFAAAG